MSHPLGTTANPREVELKFHLPRGSRVVLERFPALAAAAADHNDLVTTYFDTPDRALDRRGLSLRVRRSGGHRIQTVKSRAGGHGVASSRGEWTWPIAQDAPEVDCLARTKPLAAAALAIEGRLQPAFVTRIQRTTRLVRLDENTTVEVEFDEGDIEAGAAREPVSELELELKCGSVGPLYRLAAELQSTAPLWLMSESKSARGWRLRTGQSEGAKLARRPKLKPKVAAAAGFRQLLDGTLGHLMANIGPTLGGDPEGLRQSRLAIREARTVLQMFAPYLDVAGAPPLLKALRGYGELLGAARDWDVFCLQTLPAALGDMAGERLENLDEAAGVERQAAHAAVALAVRGRAFSEMVLGLMIWADVGAVAPLRNKLGPERQGLADLAPALLDRAAGNVKRRGRRIARLTEAERHALRKSLKKLDFNVECLAGFHGAHGVKRYRRRCEAVEGLLGAANDAVVTERLALALAANDPADLTRPAQALAQWSRERGRKALKSLPGAMADFREAMAFWR